MLAPIRTGGGVRVKLLDAIRIGLPVVATSPAIGSLSTTFDLTPFDDDESFTTECRRLLTDRDAAVRAGDQLFETNGRFGSSGVRTGLWMRCFAARTRRLWRAHEVP
jgi:hypothetical protein